MAKTRSIDLENGLKIQVTCAESEKMINRTGEYDIITSYAATYKNERCDSYDIDNVLEFVRKIRSRIIREKVREERELDAVNREYLILEKSLNEFI